MTRRRHTLKVKFKGVMDALSERFTIQELGRRYEINPTQIPPWKTQLSKNALS